jgi:hypothetical protein
MHKLILTLVLGLFLIPNSHATHVAGANISYEYVKDSVFDFYLYFYRDCRGVPFKNPSKDTKIKCAYSSKSASVTLTLTSIKDVTFLCNSVKRPCSPKNTGFTGNGLEEHLYKVRIDFSKSPYSGLAGCGDLILETGQCCRTTSITTGTASSNFYVFMKFNPFKVKKNSSPSYFTSPRKNICCNMPAILNFAATDRDGDSLSYRVINPLRGWNQNASYSSSYSAAKPLNVYNPSGSKSPNPYFNPPIGYYIGPSNGMVIFTPTTCSDVTNITIEIKEWKKISGGRYQLIGTFIRETTIEVSTCPSNNPPIISAPSSLTICQGDSVSFTVKTDDKILVPPPPLPKPDPDSVSLDWNRGIPDATFTVVNDTALHQNAAFSWKPDSQAASIKPYEILVFAKDNSCRTPGTSIKRILFYVYDSADASFKINQLACGRYEILALDTTSESPYRWSLHDSSGRTLSGSDSFRFLSDTNAFSSLRRDTMVFYESGDYVLRLTRGEGNCKEIKEKSIGANKHFKLIEKADTLVCFGTRFSLTIDSASYTFVSSYKWKYDGRTQTGKIFDDTVTSGLKHLIVEVVGISGCHLRDSIQMQSIYSPLVNDINDTVICETTQLSLNARNARDSGIVLNTFLWSNGDSGSAFNNYLEEGFHWVKISNFCGNSGDSFFVQTDSILIPDLGRDQTLCDSDSFFIGYANSRSDVNYLWNSGDTASWIYAHGSDQYKLTVWNTCANLSDSVNISFDSSPYLEFPDTIFYCDEIKDEYDAGNPGALHSWHDGSFSQIFKVSKEGWYKVEVMSQNCGSTSDSTYADLTLSPSVELGKDTILKKPFSLLLTGGSSEAQYLWNTGDKTESITVNDFGTYWVEHVNHCDSVRDSIEVIAKVGVDDINILSDWIIPNPSRGSFILKTEGDYGKAQVFNELGQEVFFKITIGGEHLELELYDPVPGIYHIVYDVEGVMMRGKFLVL